MKFFRLLLKNVVRNKVRTLVTMASIALGGVALLAISSLLVIVLFDAVRRLGEPGVLRCAQCRYDISEHRHARQDLGIEVKHRVAYLQSSGCLRSPGSPETY